MACVVFVVILSPKGEESRLGLRAGLGLFGFGPFARSGQVGRESLFPRLRFSQSEILRFAQNDKRARYVTAMARPLHNQRQNQVPSRQEK